MLPRLFTQISSSRQSEVARDLDQATREIRDYLLLVFLSCVIATFGLVLNSGAVVIGAMLIAPLMSAILTLALALVRGDLRRLWRALALALAGGLLAVALSALLGTLVSLSGLNLLEALPAEILTRTQPTLFDLAIALAGGAAAAYALAQPELSATLPGVAIATALMPPLCVVGIGLSQQRLDLAWGALLLFLANFVAIVFAGSLIFTALGFGALARARRADRAWAMYLPAGLILLVALPLVGFMIQTVRDAQDNVTIRTTLLTELTQLNNGSRLVSFEKEWQGDQLALTATIRTPATLTAETARTLQDAIAAAVQQPVALKLVVIPITILEPRAPPVRSPTPMPATATPGRRDAP